MPGSPNPLHSTISNCAGANSWNRARRDGGTKVESGGVLEGPVKVLEIEEGMPRPKEPGIAKSSKASRLVRRPAPLDIPSID